MKKIVQEMFWKQFLQFTAISFLVTLVSVLLGIAIRWRAHQEIWYGDEPVWMIWSWIRDHLTLSIAGVLIVSMFFAAFFALRKSYRYLESVLEATESIYVQEEEAIQLQPELREVEGQLNQVKFQLERNIRVAKEAEQRKNDLIVYLAHDLKTPLTSVIGYLTLLRDEGQISEELRTKYLSISLEKAESL